MSEVSTGVRGERVDAIGFRVQGGGEGSVLIECKTSRADFLADRLKPHRKAPALGVGNYRYMLAPEGLIAIEELPEKWGLIEVNSRGHSKTIRGGHTQESLELSRKEKEGGAYYFEEVNQKGEQFLLVRAMANSGDPQQTLDRIREAQRITREWEKRFESVKKALGFGSNYRYVNTGDVLHKIEELKAAQHSIPSIF